MAKKLTFDPRKLMEMAVDVMKASIREKRSDDTITPKVGAVLWKPDGTVQTACRGELREGDHAEYTLLERKNVGENLGDCVLFATLEPCGPESRNSPKIGCARRITNARIKIIYYGCEDPHRKGVNDIFFELVREGIANAIVHRDYDISGGKIQIMVEEDTVTIRSPGAPVAPITIEQLQSFSAPMVSRNPRLHAVFSTMELAEERGLGLKSMRTKATEAGLPLPRFSFNEPYLDLTLYRTAEAATHSLPEETRAQLSKSERKGWEWVVSKQTVTSTEYENALGVSNRTALNHLNKFTILGLAKRVGSGTATEYEVVS